MFIILAGISVMSLTSVILVSVVSSVYNGMLYETLSESLAYSSEEISDYLQDTEELSMMILSDEKIQSDLVSIKEEPDSLKAVNAVQQIRSNLGGYYQNHSDNILKYMTLYTEMSNAYTNILRADEVPEQVQEKMIEAAAEKKGKPAWITEYLDTYGLFLARSIRRIENAKLDEIGTVLISIDIGKLIDSVTEFENQYDETGYILANGEQTLYYTDNLTEEKVKNVISASTDFYDIYRGQNSEYFVVHGSLPDYKWDYYCIVSYDKIANRIRGIFLCCLAVIFLDMLAVICGTQILMGHVLIHISYLTDKMSQFQKDNTKVPQVPYDYTNRNDELGILHRRFDNMSATIIRLIQEQYINEILKKETKIKMLENQINPHFLYNTLGSIKWRAQAIGEKDIAAMVDALSILFRFSLSKEKDNFTLGDEMEIVNSYLTIQKLRYEERLTVEDLTDRNCYSVCVPKLSIQPLVENAITYGVETNIDGAEIVLKAQISRGVLHIYVKNTGSEIEEDLIEKLENGERHPHGHGIGLININSRVKMQFGNKYGLRFYQEEDYAVAEMTVPAEGKNYAEADNCG